MMPHTSLAAIAALLALQGMDAGAAEPSVEVFTLSTLPLKNVGNATVYYVDAVELLEQYLSMNLPADPTRAQQLVAQRIAAFGPRLAEQARSGAGGVARAAQLGLQRAPVVVFDARWAVYGMTDVDAARMIFARRAPHDRR